MFGLCTFEIVFWSFRHALWRKLIIFAPFRASWGCMEQRFLKDSLKILHFGPKNPAMSNLRKSLIKNFLRIRFRGFEMWLSRLCVQKRLMTSALYGGWRQHGNVAGWRQHDVITYRWWCGRYGGGTHGSDMAGGHAGGWLIGWLYRGGDVGCWRHQAVSGMWRTAYGGWQFRREGLRHSPTPNTWWEYNGETAELPDVKGRAHRG